MPKAAVDEHHHTPAPKDEIGLANNFLISAPANDCGVSHNLD